MIHFVIILCVCVCVLGVTAVPIIDLGKVEIENPQDTIHFLDCIIVTS